MAHVIVKENLYNKDFVGKHTVFKRLVDPCPPPKVEKVTWDQYVKFLDEYTPEMAEKISKCPKEDIIKAARWFAQSKGNHEPLDNGVESEDKRRLGK